KFQKAGFTARAPETTGVVGFFSILLAGRSAHDAATSARKTSGATMSAAPSPTKARVAAAPVRSKKKPAYAHSFTRGMPGTVIATAPSNFQTPMMTAKYGGYP